MKMEQLISDDEFRAQRLLLSDRLTGSGGNPGSEAKPESVLNDLDTICAPLMHLDEAWENVPTDFKRRFQQIAIPAGYIYGRVGTAQKGRLLSFIESPDAANTNGVPLMGQSWNQLAEEIKAFAAIFREVMQSRQEL